jgi:hypothetical protein
MPDIFNWGHYILCCLDLLLGVTVSLYDPPMLFPLELLENKIIISLRQQLIVNVVSFREQWKQMHYQESQRMILW